MGMLNHEHTVAIFIEQAQALAEGGARSSGSRRSSRRGRRRVEAARKTGLPVCATLTFDTARRSMMGVTPADYAAFATEIGLDLVGANCGVGPAELDSTQGLVAAGIDIPVVTKGNCGIRNMPTGKYTFTAALSSWRNTRCMREMRAPPSRRVCTTPEHVAAMVNALNSTPKRTLDKIAMTAALGTPWAALAEAEAGSTVERRRRGRRRDHQ